MKKIIFGAALLFVIGTTQAAPIARHSEPHNISSSELPPTLLSAIKTTYAGYWITDLTQEGDGRRAKYVITLESPDQVLHLQATKADGWEVLTTMVKEQ